jgi:fumarylacetoacetase
VYSTHGAGGRRIGIRYGDRVLDAASLLPDTVFRAGSLVPFLRRGLPAWRDARARVQRMLTEERERGAVEESAVALDRVRMHRPFEVGDYVDFYASEHHARNAGRILRPGRPPLASNWKHMPVGYHGRASTVTASGTDVVRPRGQRHGDDGPVFGPTRKLDFEAEVAFVVGTASTPGEAVGVHHLHEHVFGVCLLNDWSARDVQAWESRPLGPFLGKSFATSVSPWIVALDALSDAWTDPPPRTHHLLPYLDGGRGLDIALEVRLNGQVVSRPPFASMYWTPAQMLAHLTVNGAPVRAGDLFASGTVSGPERSQWGSLLELSEDGTRPLRLDDGSVRTYLEDADEVTISASAPGPGGEVICLGDVSGRIVPARG